MIYGFLNGKIVSVEEYLIDYSIRTGQSIHIPTDLLNMSITFDNKEVDAFVLEVIDDKLVIQLALPIREKFDDKSNVYKTSYIRQLLNSDKFLSRFNKEFVEHIKQTEIHTNDYITDDKLWLLSHEEINQQTYFLKTNNNSFSFDLFKNVDLKSYSKILLLNLNKQNCCGWRLRSAYSCAYIESYSRCVGYVDYNGSVGYDNAIYTDIGILPACIIG